MPTTTLTNGADIYLGTFDDDTIFALGGDDVVEGGSGADTIYGGLGVDRLIGGDQNDTIYGDSGADSIFGGTGNDRLVANSGNDTLYGGFGQDQLFDMGGINRLFGDDGLDRFFFRSTVLATGSRFYEGDAFAVADGSFRVSVAGKQISLSTFDGGAGTDSLNATNQADFVQLDSNGGTPGGAKLYSAVEVFNLLDGDDVLDFSSQEFAASSSDPTGLTIYGATGNDVLWSGVLSDLIYGGDGNDQIIGGGGQDTAFGGDGNDFIYDPSGLGSAYGGSGSDIIYGGAGVHRLFGGSGNDTLNGGLSNDTIFGGDGDDTVIRSANNLLTQNGSLDSAEGGSGTDTFRLLATTATSHFFQIQDGTSAGIAADQIRVLSDDGEIFSGVDHIRGFETIEIIGLDGNDSSAISGNFAPTNLTKLVFYGADGNDAFDASGASAITSSTLYGGSGSDALVGTSGSDYLNGGSGQDVLFGGMGNDQFQWDGTDLSYIGGAGIDTILGTAQQDVIYLDAVGLNSLEVVNLDDGNDWVIGVRDQPGATPGFTVIGGSGKDRISMFNTGNDRVFGGFGNDTVWGGAGDDAFFGGNDDDQFYAGAGADIASDGPGHDIFYLGHAEDSLEITGITAEAPTNDALVLWWGQTNGSTFFGFDPSEVEASYNDVNDTVTIAGRADGSTLVMAVLTQGAVYEVALHDVSGTPGQSQSGGWPVAVPYNYHWDETARGGLGAYVDGDGVLL